MHRIPKLRSLAWHEQAHVEEYREACAAVYTRLPKPSITAPTKTADRSVATKKRRPARTSIYSSRLLRPRSRRPLITAQQQNSYPREVSESTRFPKHHLGRLRMPARRSASYIADESTKASYARFATCTHRERYQYRCSPTQPCDFPRWGRCRW